MCPGPRQWATRSVNHFTSLGPFQPYSRIVWTGRELKSKQSLPFFLQIIEKNNLTRNLVGIRQSLILKERRKCQRRWRRWRARRCSGTRMRPSLVLSTSSKACGPLIPASTPLFSRIRMCLRRQSSSWRACSPPTSEFTSGVISIQKMQFLLLLLLLLLASTDGGLLKTWR